MRERKRSASKTNPFAEARRVRRLEAAERRRLLEERETALRTALARPRPGARQAVEQFLVRQPKPSRKLRELLTVVADRAPRILSEDCFPAFVRMARAPWVRPAPDWAPAGKGRERLFGSLAAYLFARYPMPAFLWSAFEGRAGRSMLEGVALHIAAGGSLFEAVKSGLMPVPLTRKMCHDVLLRGGEGTFLEVVRRVQVKAAGGNGRLLRAWLSTEPGGRLSDRESETFWQTVLAWLGANPTLPPSEVGPLVDYIAMRRRQNPAFSMRGRSVLSLMREVGAWHDDLAGARDWLRCSFAPSGFEAMDLDRSRDHADGSRLVEVWHFREVLDSQTLADEGKAMGHCVYSYADRILQGECSIWTLTLENATGHWRRLTLEVRNRARRIVQVRGRFNRMPKTQEVIALRAWATRNRLDIIGGGVG